MRTKTIWMGIAALLAAASAGCASWFLNGARQHQGGTPANATATFEVRSCRQLSDGADIGAPAGQRYVLAQEAQGPVLYELDQNGSGAAIYNYWQDERGVHFFVWVGRSHGWVYTFPHTRDQLPTRWVFPAGSYRVTQAPNGGSMPDGQPQAACQMVPV